MTVVQMLVAEPSNSFICLSFDGYHRTAKDAGSDRTVPWVPRIPRHFIAPFRLNSAVCLGNLAG
jgi:hypothetical protein